MLNHIVRYFNDAQAMNFSTDFLSSFLFATESNNTDRSTC